MNNQFFYIPLIFLINACSVSPDAEISTSQHAKSAPAKQQTHRHKKSTEGVISVDIVSQNDQLHLLIGKLQQDKKTLWYQFITILC